MKYDIDLHIILQHYFIIDFVGYITIKLWYYSTGPEYKVRGTILEREEYRVRG